MTKRWASYTEVAWEVCLIGTDIVFNVAYLVRLFVSHMFNVA